ncbi:hypothetical protein CN198_13840 [Sinorhizobium meliloti]|uniref:hypothetical protein n=1 Tax=Rhizobium meliloti TaxID=382 RepID=UPI000FDCB914|nr:hypothetical protein [Sinorhizobium meliloti]RVH69144.1 hypothetical protein CN198_13840 [Sinorhizobium meliloti]
MRNVDYFVFGDFDTRRGVEANAALLKDGKRAELFDGTYVVNGTDPKTDKHVEILVTDGEISRIIYSLAMNTYLHADQEIRAIESKYGFDLLPGRKVTEFPAITSSFVITYACDEKKRVWDQDLCSVKLYSMNDAKSPITNITWTNLPLERRLEADRLKETQAKLP